MVLKHGPRRTRHIEEVLQAISDSDSDSDSGVEAGAMDTTVTEASPSAINIPRDPCRRHVRFDAHQLTPGRRNKNIGSLRPARCMGSKARDRVICLRSNVLKCFIRDVFGYLEADVPE